MEIFEPLPWPLKSKFNQEISLSVQERLVYLWTASHKLATSTPLISHGLSRSFIKLSEQYNIELPPFVSNRICNHCAAILIPSVNCVVRIRGRTKQSRANKIKSNKLNCNLKNEITVKCHNCHTLSSTRIGCERKHSLQSSVNKPDILLMNPTTPPKATKKFSFLESSIRRASAPPSLSTITTTPTPNIGKFQSESMEEDFIPLTPIIAPPPSTFTSTSKNITYNPIKQSTITTKVNSSYGSRGVYRIAATHTSNTNMIKIPSLSLSRNKVDLLEIEKANKKLKKRNRAEALGPPVSPLLQSSMKDNNNNNNKRNSTSLSCYGSATDKTTPSITAYNLPRNTTTGTTFSSTSAISTTTTTSLSSLGVLQAILKNKK